MDFFILEKKKDQGPFWLHFYNLIFWSWFLMELIPHLQFWNFCLYGYITLSQTAFKILKSKLKCNSIRNHRFFTLNLDSSFPKTLINIKQPWHQRWRHTKKKKKKEEKTLNILAWKNLLPKMSLKNYFFKTHILKPLLNFGPC